MSAPATDRSHLFVLSRSLGNRRRHGSTGQVGLYRPDFRGYFLSLLFLVSERLCPSQTPTLGALFRRFVTGEKELLNLKLSIHVQDVWNLAWSVVN